MLIILGRLFLATSNVLINCRNDLMQLTFGSITMEVNDLNLCKKPDLCDEGERDPKKACLIDTIVNEHMESFMSHDFDTYYGSFDDEMHMHHGESFTLNIGNEGNPLFYPS